MSPVKSPARVMTRWPIVVEAQSVFENCMALIASAPGLRLRWGWWNLYSRYQLDPREQMWEEGQELLRVDDEDGEIDLWRLADLLLEDGFSLEE